MKLDELARSATDSLLAGTTTDPTTGLADLKRSHRRRSTARAAAAGLVVVAVLGGALAVSGEDASSPEPAEPTVRNGALLVTRDDSPFRTVLSGGRALDLPDDHFAFYDSTFTADGRELVHTSVDGRVMAHDVVTGEARELWDCGGTRQCFWAVSPDAERLAIAVEAGIEVHTLDDGRTDLLRTPEPPGAYLDWSPDGRSLVFSGREHLYTIGADGAHLRRLVPTEPLHTEYPPVQWSPDGRTIAFVESTPLEEPRSPTVVVESSFALRLVGSDGENLRTVQDLGVCACLGLIAPDIAWAPDGTGIAFTKVGRVWPRGVHLLDLESGKAQELNADGNGFLVWQPAYSQ